MPESSRTPARVDWHCQPRMDQTTLVHGGLNVIPEYLRTGGTIRHQPQIAGSQSPEPQAGTATGADSEESRRSVVASISCIRSRDSAGPMVDNGVTDQMVGDRRSPGATILGVESPTIAARPADRFRTSRCLVVWTVYEMAILYIQTGSCSVLGLRFVV